MRLLAFLLIYVILFVVIVVIGSLLYQPDSILRWAILLGASGLISAGSASGLIVWASPNEQDQDDDF